MLSQYWFCQFHRNVPPSTSGSKCIERSSKKLTSGVERERVKTNGI
jgi:hypothetical protein